MQKTADITRMGALTIIETRDGKDVLAYSYNTLMLRIVNGCLEYADYGKYSVTTSKHQRELANRFPQYQLPAKRERAYYR